MLARTAMSVVIVLDETISPGTLKGDGGVTAEMPEAPESATVTNHAARHG